MSALRTLVRLARPMLWALVGAAFLGAATVGSGVGLMATSAWLIATAALHPALGDLQVAIVGVRFFGLARGVLRYVERLAAHSLTFRLLARIRVWFYRRLEPLVPAGVARLHSGDLLTRAVSDVESLEGFYVRALAPPMVVVITAAGLALFLARFAFAVSAVATGWLLVCGLATLVGGWWLGRGSGRRLSAARAELGQAVVELVQGLPDLTAAGRCEEAAGRIETAGARVSRGAGRHAMWEAGLGASVVLGAGLAVWGTVWLAVSRPSPAGIDGVAVAVMALAVLAAFEAVESLPAAGLWFEEQRRALERILEVTEAEVSVRDPERPVRVPARLPRDKPALRCQDLRFTYPGGGRPALDGLDLEVGVGERVAVVGPSGAGKSTLLALLLRLFDGWSGCLEVGGVDVRATAQEELRSSLAVLEQGTHLFSATVRENLLLGRPDANEADLWRVLEIAGLAAEVRAMPEGLETWVGEQGLTLSGGQRRRLAVARTALREAPLLLLDEPTAGLDRVTEAGILSALETLAKGRTSLTVTHRLLGMQRYDAIWVMERGRVVEKGAHRDLVNAGGVYARLWKAQENLIRE